MQNMALRRCLSYGRSRKKFTGKERDAETGLYYYGARYLDPKTSRWLSGDPAMGEYLPSAPVNDEAKKHNEKLPNGGVYNYISLHSYNYSNNNPVKYSDPDGKIPFMIVTGIIGAVAGAGISIAADVAAGRDINWGRAGLAAGAGALAGLTLGATAAAAATATPLVAGNAAASFSTVAGYVSGTVAPAFFEVVANAKKFSDVEAAFFKFANEGAVEMYKKLAPMVNNGEKYKIIELYWKNFVNPD
jgi:RHS repeat-associated protein